MNKKIITISGTFVLCFVLNLLKHNQVSVAFFNSLLLAFSILLFVNFNDKKITKIRCFFLITLAAIPLFAYNPKNISINLNKDHSIFSMIEVQDGIKKHQKDALYIPFRLRPLIYNDLIYINFSLSRIADFISLKTLYDILLLANLYPFFWGLKRKKFIAFAAILVALLLIGINKSPDKFSSFFIISPILVYFILRGLEKVNTKIYLFLLAVSLVIITGPSL